MIIHHLRHSAVERAVVASSPLQDKVDATTLISMLISTNLNIEDSEIAHI